MLYKICWCELGFISQINMFISNSNPIYPPYPMCRHLFLKSTTNYKFIISFFFSKKMSLQECDSSWLHSDSLGAISLGKKKKKRSRFHKFLRCSHVESLFMCGVKVCEPLIQTTWLLLVVRRCERGGMEPCQRTACRQESWASTVGYLSSPSASDDVAISSVSATCTSSDLILCTTNHTGRKSTTCLSALRTRKKTRGDGPACAAIYLLQL